MQFEGNDKANYRLWQQMEILFSFGANYRILSAWNLLPEKAVLLIVNSGQSRRIIKTLTDDRHILDDQMPIKKWIDLITSSNSRILVFPYHKGKKAKGLAEFLARIYKIGEVAGYSVSALTLIIAEDVPPELNLDDFFTIYLDGDIDHLSICLKDVVPPDNQLPVVEELVRRYTVNSDILMENSLLAATMFLYPKWDEKEKQKLLKSFRIAVCEMIKKDDENRGISEIKELFISLLYFWQEETGYHKVFALPEISDDLKNTNGKYILYDDKYVYMKERLFREIVSLKLSFININILKACLANDGLLITDRSNAYSVKIMFTNCGRIMRERFLRFDRSKIIRVGEMDWIDLCEDMKETL